MKKIIIVCGATAVGKSSLAVDIAKQLNSQIISCDSMQIYRCMDIGTAKVQINEMQGIQHHMIDIVQPQESFSVSQYADMCKPIIDQIHANNMIPIIVGGTGLYIDSIIYPMTMGGGVDYAVRNQLTDLLKKHGSEYLHDKLKAIDPEDAAKIHPNNTKRLIRALEIYMTSGKTKSMAQDKQKQLQYDIYMIFLNPDRNALYDKINQRVDQMFELGLINECKNLIDNNVSWDCQSMQAIGYKELKPYFENQANIDSVKQQIKINSRHYAKRQICWFKRYEFAKQIDSFDPQQIKVAIDTAVEFSK